MTALSEAAEILEQSKNIQRRVEVLEEEAKRKLAPLLGKRVRVTLVKGRDGKTISGEGTFVGYKPERHVVTDRVTLKDPDNMDGIWNVGSEWEPCVHRIESVEEIRPAAKVRL